MTNARELALRNYLAAKIPAGLEANYEAEARLLGNGFKAGWNAARNSENRRRRKTRNLKPGT